MGITLRHGIKGMDYRNLAGCFHSPKALPSDIDAVVGSDGSRLEHVGAIDQQFHCLLVENKHKDEGGISDGNERLRKFLGTQKNFTLLTVWHDGSEENKNWAFSPTAYQFYGQERVSVALDDFKVMLRKWWNGNAA